METKAEINFLNAKNFKAKENPRKFGSSPRILRPGKSIKRSGRYISSSLQEHFLLGLQ